MELTAVGLKLTGERGTFLSGKRIPGVLLMGPPVCHPPAKHFLSVVLYTAFANSVNMRSPREKQGKEGQNSTRISVNG